MKYYRQCTFKRLTEEGMVQTIGWAQEEKAKVGRKATLEDQGDKLWWDIVAVSNIRLPEKFVKVCERSYLHQRSVSDI